MPEYMSLVLFATVFGVLLLGFPVAFTLDGVSLIFGYFTFGMSFFQLLPLRIWGTMTNDVLIAVPLFVYMGLMLEKSGLAEELLETMAMLFGKLRGGGWLFLLSSSGLSLPHRQESSEQPSSPWVCCHYRPC